jgi:HEAT repeat protein
MRPSNLKIAVTAMCDVLRKDANPLIRLKAAEVLAKLGSEEAIPTLCDAWKHDPDFNLRLAAADAISQILNSQTPNARRTQI